MAYQRTEILRASPRMFENELLNRLSRVHPAVPAIIYGPVVVLMIGLAAEGGYPAAGIAALAAAGVLIWTLTEYLLHRVVFHWEPGRPLGRRIHFIVHGVHHEHPNDRVRLVMPPAASIPLGALFLGAFALLLGTPAAYPLFAGLLLGYLGYDYTHYHIHHHAPRTRIGRRIREHHLRHHFQDASRGFGVSSPLWDYVFGTMPKRRR